VAPGVHGDGMPKDAGRVADLTGSEREEVEERKPPRAQVLYEAIRLEGEHELDRPASALAWSGFAAGMSMGFSLLTMGLLRAYLPDAPWSRIIVSFGYCVGFVVVITARQQLFTENTLTPVLPFLAHKDARTLFKVLRLWGIVLVTNLLGTLAFAVALHFATAFPAEARAGFSAIARQVTEGSFGAHFVGAVFSGWLIALMVWMLAGASSRAFIVVMVTYVIGLANLAHVIGGSTEMLYAVLDGVVEPLSYFTHFLIPVCAGNLLGGIALVALLNHAPVAADSKDKGSSGGGRRRQS
jgi:formate/nitrite transporter FocA (FNT family)